MRNLSEILSSLRYITHNCRPNMHEPSLADEREARQDKEAKFQIEEDQ